MLKSHMQTLVAVFGSYFLAATQTATPTAYDEAGLIAVARAAVIAAVQDDTYHPKGETLARPVFVTIERKGKVLGCRGSLATKAASLELAVAEAAMSAAKHDPRYRPLGQSDLKDFLVTVTVVEELQPVDSVAGLTPSDGLVLQAGGRFGVVLPWEGKDPYTRLKWAYTKAGVAPGARCSLSRLVGKRFRG